MAAQELIFAFAIICIHLMQIPAMQMIGIENTERKCVGIIVQSCHYLSSNG